MGRLLFELGGVPQRTMHKFEKESAAAGKASFKWAWVLDENQVSLSPRRSLRVPAVQRRQKRSEAKRLLGAQEERARGVTMDVGVTHFETERVRFTLLDAPVPLRSPLRLSSPSCTAAELASFGWGRGTVISSRR